MEGFCQSPVKNKKQSVAEWLSESEALRKAASNHQTMWQINPDLQGWTSDEGRWALDGPRQSLDFLC